MNLGELLKYVQFLAVKENSGYVYTPEQFNLNLPIVVQEMFNNLVAEYERTKILSDALAPYKVKMGDINAPLMVDSNGHATIPTDYQRWDSFAFKLNSTVGNSTMTEFRPIEFLTKGQYDFRLSSKLRPISQKYPVVTRESDYFLFAPKDLQYVEFSYLKKCETPYYDFYYDIYSNPVYLSPSTSHLLVSPEEGSQGQTSGTVYSLSVELSLPDFTHPKLALMLLSKVGINIRDTEVIQYAEMEVRK